MMNKLHPIRLALCAGVLAVSLLAALPVAAKTDAPVRISAATSGSPRVGQPLTVALSFRTEKSGQLLSVRYTIEGTVVLQSPASEQLSSDAEGRATTTLTLTPTGDGPYFLNVFATVGGRTQAVSVPLAVVSTDTRRSSPQSRSAAQSRGGFIQLEAIETVR
jgi:hypothetical protein